MIRLATFARRVALIGLLHLLCAALPAAAADLASGASVPPAPAISRDEALAELKRVQAALDRIKQQRRPRPPTSNWTRSTNRRKR